MIIELKQGFRSRRNMSRLERLWHPGTYTVDTDMPREVAEAAIKAGAASEIKPAVAVEETRPAATQAQEGDSAPAPQPTFRGRRARRAAPENKAAVE